MRLWILAAVPLGLALSLSGADRVRPTRASRQAAEENRRTSDALSAQLDAMLARAWSERDLRPADEVDALRFLRRVWLDLLGTVPSLEEVRWVEALPTELAPAARRAAIYERALADERFDEVLAERLTRIAVGSGGRPDDLLYRRRRLVVWVTAQLRRERRWDEITRDLLTATGTSVDAPAVNFTRSQDADPLKLASRTTRSFLGVRIDCAQCHDHPFARWKQADFEGLAAWFGQVREGGAGVRDESEGELELEVVPKVVLASDAPPADEVHAGVPEDDDEASRLMTATPAPPPAMGAAPARPRETRVVAPRVPFQPELLPPEGPSRRARLAAWVTHPQNQFFARALVNRLWKWLMGRGVVEPADELDMTRPSQRELLDALSDDFVAHGFDVARTVRAIVATRAYALDSRAAQPEREDDAVAAWACQPLKPLRADQLAAAVAQTGSFWTYDARRAPLPRLIQFGRTNDFVRRHGDDLSAEDPEEETLLQRLHLLNGKSVAEGLKDDDIFGPTTRLPLLAPSDEAALDAAFLMTLTRRPTAREREHFLARLAGARSPDGRADGKARAAVMADLLWALVNSTEFAWSH